VTDIGIRIAVSACRHAMAGNLSDTPLGMEMHVALNNPTGASGSRRTIRASVAAWLTFLSWLQAESRTAPGDGHRAEERAACLARARKAISREFDRLAKHPAYRGIAVAGTSTTVFPAYRLGEGRWWPSPDMAWAASDGTTTRMEQADLVPATTQMNGRVFTYWGAEYLTPQGC
jgi:hypothetical protein